MSGWLEAAKAVASHRTPNASAPRPRFDVTGATMDAVRRRTDASRLAMDSGGPRANAANLPSDAGDARLGVSVPADGRRRSVFGQRCTRR